MKTTLSNITRSLLVLTAIGAFAVPAARADQPAMKQARELANQAHEVLKNNATLDKGGHRVAAMKLLKQAVEEINAGIEFDKTHDSANEGKKRKQ